MIYFMDTSFVLALYDRKDKYHKEALEIKQSFTDNDKFFLTDAIILEIGNSLSHPKFRKDIIQFIDSIRRKDNFVIFPISKKLLNEGLKIFSKHQDKYWGLIDCISFFVMKSRKISVALTTDSHFKQAGFISPLIK